MPFPGIPAGSELEAKIDRCVEDVMRDDSDMDKSTAIAICRDSIEGKEMTDKTEDKQTNDADNAKKSMPFVGYPTTLGDLEKLRMEMKRTEEMRSLFDDFQFVAHNILHSDEVNDKQRPGLIRQLADDLAERLRGAATMPNGEVDMSTLTGRKEKDAEQTGQPGLIEKMAKRLLGRDSKEDEQGNSFLMWKEAGGNLFWLARYSNKYRDNDKPSEIVSDESHRKFAALVKEGIVPPPKLWIWHRPEWEIGQADWVAYDDVGFAVAGGHVYDDPVCKEAADALRKLEDVKVSHGMPYWSIRRDPDDESVIKEHITVEISPLPGWAAANQLTGFIVLKEKDDMAISKEDKERIMKTHGVSEELLEQLEAMNSQQAKEANAEGIEAKETDAQVDADEGEGADAADTPEADAADVATDNDESEVTMAELASALQTTMKSVAALGKQFQVALKEIEELKGADEQKIAQKARQTPLASMQEMMIKSVIGDDETRVDGRTSLAKQGPKETEGTDAPPARTGIPLVDGWLNGQ